MLAIRNRLTKFRWSENTPLLSVLLVFVVSAPVHPAFGEVDNIIGLISGMHEHSTGVTLPTHENLSVEQLELIGDHIVDTHAQMKRIAAEKDISKRNELVREYLDIVHAFRDAFH